MYTPAHFAESDPEQLFAFMAAHSFALLVSRDGEEPVASHLPLLIDREAGPHGTLVGHMARANPQWRHADGAMAVAVFSGPHAYVSPTWYAAENVVPTWNYVAVHAYGVFRAIQDPAVITEIIRDTTRQHERNQPRPWSVDGSEDLVRRLVPHVVGFRVEIARLEGKWKLSQNHPAERRANVAARLSERGDEGSREIARLMRSTLPGFG